MSDPPQGNDPPGAPPAGDSTRAWLQAILDNVPDAVIVIDERGVVESFSAAAERMFGYSAAEIVGRNVSALMPAPYRNDHDSYIDRYHRTGQRRIIGIGRVVPGQRKDGTTLPLELTVGEAATGRGRIYIGFARDISARKDIERRLADLQAELTQVSRLSDMDQMGSTLAHEMNQPLTALLAYLDAARRLLAKPDGRAEARVILERARTQVTRAGTIIHRLREMLGKDNAVRRPEPINKVVEEASARALVGTAHLAVQSHLDLDPSAPIVPIDRVQIQQVLVNLIRNAIEAMSGGATRDLLVRTAGADSLVRVSVRDSGPGIAADIASRLFEPFVSTKANGMGIGLSICRSIVRAHGGDIEAQPNTRGPGTTFFFTLPRLRAGQY
jgi:two-component system sensor kinase FixL